MRPPRRPGEHLEHRRRQQEADAEHDERHGERSVPSTGADEETPAKTAIRTPGTTKNQGNSANGAGTRCRRTRHGWRRWCRACRSCPRRCRPLLHEGRRLRWAVANSSGVPSAGWSSLVVSSGRRRSRPGTPGSPEMVCSFMNGRNSSIIVPPSGARLNISNAAGANAGPRPRRGSRRGANGGRPVAVAPHRHSWWSRYGRHPDHGRAGRSPDAGAGISRRWCSSARARWAGCGSRSHRRWRPATGRPGRTGR